MTNALSIETPVRFREDSPQHAANAGLVWFVMSEPLPNNGAARPYVELLLAADTGKTRSRQRRRLAYVDALEVV